jgi:hypothetical protein
MKLLSRRGFLKNLALTISTVSLLGKKVLPAITTKEEQQPQEEELKSVDEAIHELHSVTTFGQGYASSMCFASGYPYIEASHNPEPLILTAGEDSNHTDPLPDIAMG